MRLRKDFILCRFDDVVDVVVVREMFELEVDFDRDDNVGLALCTEASMTDESMLLRLESTFMSMTDAFVAEAIVLCLCVGASKSRINGPKRSRSKEMIICPASRCKVICDLTDCADDAECVCNFVLDIATNKM
jgi:hypothetical protein